MLEIFADNFSNCVWLAVLIIALIPTLESKIAIPFGMSVQIFGKSALHPIVACVIAMVGSLLPALVVLVVARKLKSKTAGFVSDKFLSVANAKVKKHFEKFSEKTTVLKKCLYLVGFVALPLPLTGVYTGSLIAGLSSLKFWQGLLSVVIGELLTCVGITTVCAVFENSAFYIFIMSIILVIGLLLANLSIMLFGKLKKKCAK